MTLPHCFFVNFSVSHQGTGSSFDPWSETLESNGRSSRNPMQPHKNRSRCKRGDKWSLARDRAAENRSEQDPEQEVKCGIMPHKPLVADSNEKNRDRIHDYGPHRNLGNIEFKRLSPRSNKIINGFPHTKQQLPTTGFQS